MDSQTKVILVIDDSPEDQEMYKRLLRKEPGGGYKVLTTDSGESGLEILEQRQVDCVLLDYNLPDMDGIELLHAIGLAKELSMPPVVFLTGQGSEAIAVQAMKSGAEDYLVKSSLSQELLSRTIRHAMASNKAKRDLEEHNLFLDTLIDTIPYPVFYNDISGMCLNCNNAASVFIGADKAEILGKSIYDLVGRYGEAFKKHDQELLNRGGISTIESTTRFQADDPRNIILKQATYEDSDGKTKGIVGVIVDITERKQMEIALKETARELDRNVRELERANTQILKQQKAVIEEERLKVLLQMAGATAHELNQPLTALLGNIELLSLHLDNPQKLRHFLEAAEEAGERISSIVGKIQTIRHYEVRPYQGQTTILEIDQALNILVVEDNDQDYGLLQDALKEHGKINIRRVKDLPQALPAIEEFQPDLIILDYLLPSGTGLEFLATLGREGIEIPVVVVTGQGDEMVASRIIQCGAYDYLPKSKISATSISRMINNAMEKFRLKLEIQQAMDKMAEMSTRDELTGLFNRRYFMDTLEREIEAAKRHKTPLSLCILDLDHFKTVNDTFGHLAGDDVLRNVSSLVQKHIRKCDIPSRFGGEEFAIILPRTSLSDALPMCERIREAIELNEFRPDGTATKLTVSIGLAQHDSEDSHLCSDFIKRADDALYTAKESGRNQVCKALPPLETKDKVGQDLLQAKPYPN